MPVRFHLEDTKYHTRIFAHFVSPPATARANAERNHFPHHLLTVAALGGPVGRARQTRAAACQTWTLPSRSHPVEKRG